MPAAKIKPAFRFTGWHMFVILFAFFSVVFGVNFYMARLAMHTFSGEVVTNSYDASQNYNKWLDEAAKEKALGWKMSVARLADGRVAVRFADGSAVPVPAKAEMTGEAWHPLGLVADHDVRFVRGVDGSFVTTQALPDGRWNLRLKLIGEGAQGRISWHGQEAI